MRVIFGIVVVFFHINIYAYSRQASPTFTEGIENIINTVVDIIITNKASDIPEDPSKKDSSDGSGFIIDECGLILTNCHVIDNSDKIEVVLYDGTKYIAKIVGKDERSDIALLKIDTDFKIPYIAKFADSDSVNILDPVFAVGNPFGFGKTVTSGIISFKGRNLSSQIAELGVGGDLVSYIQTDTAVNYGNSGGPLFTYDGKVVGMITVFVSDGMHSTGINFAIPANTIKNIVDQLKDFGKIRRSWIGITVRPLTRDVSIALGLGKRFGCSIIRIEKNSPAAIAGIQVDDILLSINDRNISDSTNIEDMLCSLPIEKVVPVQVIRDGIERKFSVKVGYKDEGENSSSVFGDEIIQKKEIPFEKLKGINIGIADLTNEYRKWFNIPTDVNGVLIANVENESSEMSVGNLILKVNHKKVSSVKEIKSELEDLIKKKEQRVALFIYDPNREPQKFYLAFRFFYSSIKRDSP